MNSYLYCHIQLEGLLYNAECDLLAIAKYLVLLKLQLFVHRSGDIAARSQDLRERQTIDTRAGTDTGMSYYLPLY